LASAVVVCEDETAREGAGVTSRPSSDACPSGGQRARGGGRRGRRREGKGVGGSGGAHLASRLRVARRGRERNERERHERYGLEEGAEEHVVEGREVVRSRGELFRAEARGKVRREPVACRALDVEIDSDDAEEAAYRAARGPPPRGTLGATDRTRLEASRALPCVRIDASERNERLSASDEFSRNLACFRAFLWFVIF
jgi:hypothetical protein